MGPLSTTWEKNAESAKGINIVTDPKKKKGSHRDLTAEGNSRDLN